MRPTSAMRSGVASDDPPNFSTFTPLTRVSGARCSSLACVRTPVPALVVGQISIRTEMDRRLPRENSKSPGGDSRGSTRERTQRFALAQSQTSIALPVSDSVYDPPEDNDPSADRSWFHAARRNSRRVLVDNRTITVNSTYGLAEPIAGSQLAHMAKRAG